MGGEIVRRVDVEECVQRTKRSRGFADEIGISRQSVSNYELGNTKVRKIVLIAWQMRTGVPVEWLETGRVTAPPVQPSRLVPFSSPIPGNLADEDGPPGTAELARGYLRKRIPLTPPIREPQMRQAMAI